MFKKSRQVWPDFQPGKASILVIVHGAASAAAAHLNAVLRNNTVGIPPPQTMTIAIGTTPAGVFSETVNNRLVKLELLGALSAEKIQAFTSLSIVPLSDCAGGSTVVGFHSVTTRVPDLFRLLIKAGQADV